MELRLLHFPPSTVTPGTCKLNSHNSSSKTGADPPSLYYSPILGPLLWLPAAVAAQCSPTRIHCAGPHPTLMLSNIFFKIV